MEIRTERDYQEALKRRAYLLEAYSFLSAPNADDLDKKISEVDKQIKRYESKASEGEI